MAKKPQKDNGRRRSRGKPRRSGDSSRFRGAKVKIEELDYKNVALLQRLTSAQGKQLSRKRSGLDAPAQRRAALAIKRARFMAMLPFIS